MHYKNAAQRTAFSWLVQRVAELSDSLGLCRPTGNRLIMETNSKNLKMLLEWGICIGVYNFFSDESCHFMNAEKNSFLKFPWRNSSY